MMFETHVPLGAGIKIPYFEDFSRFECICPLLLEVLSNAIPNRTLKPLQLLNHSDRIKSFL